MCWLLNKYKAPVTLDCRPQSHHRYISQQYKEFWVDESVMDGGFLRYFQSVARLWAILIKINVAVRIFLYYHFLNPLNSEISRQGSALQQDLHQHKQAAVLYCTVLYCTVRSCWAGWRRGSHSMSGTKTWTGWWRWGQQWYQVLVRGGQETFLPSVAADCQQNGINIRRGELLSVSCTECNTQAAINHTPRLSVIC